MRNNIAFENAYVGIEEPTSSLKLINRAFQGKRRSWNSGFVFFSFGSKS